MPRACLPSHSPPGVLRPTRRGISWTGLLIALAAVSAIGGAVWYGLGSLGKGGRTDTPVLHPVSRGVFSHVVTEDGEIESSSNIEVRCEVQSRNTSGTSILWIIEEGTQVKKGELLARLDASALTNELNQQEKVCRASEATLINARALLQTARIAKEEYLNGTFRELEQTLLAEIATAEENLRRAKDYVQYSEKLAAKGYVTQLQLEADQFAVEKAKNDLGIATTKLEVLRNYTKAKMLSTLEADIETATANVAAEESAHKLDTDKLELIKEQIAKCEIYSPSDGQVVYANQTRGRGDGNEVIIQEGAIIRERQVIIRLPDPNRMQVKTTVSESRIDRIRPRQVAVIRVDALPGVKFQGVVKRVDDYPVQGNWWSNVKEYATYVEIVGNHEGLRPGMTAEVQIQLANLSDVVQVPVQSIIEHQGHHFCLVREGDRIEPVEVTIGMTNDKFVVIDDGLNEQSQVLVAPRKYLNQVALPDLPPVVEPVQIAQVELPEDQADSPRVEPAAERGDRNRGGDSSQIATMMIERYDTDQDGQLSADELPAEGRERFAAADSNSDGFIDAQELSAAFNRMRAQRGGGGGSGTAATAGGSGGGAP